jgi:hypothetical protein
LPWLLARRKKKLRLLRLLRLPRPPLRLLLRPLRLLTLPLPRLLRPLLTLLLRPLRLLLRLLRLLLKPLRLLLLRLLRSNSNRSKRTGLRAGFFSSIVLRAFAHRDKKNRPAAGFLLGDNGIISTRPPAA